jgi:hypothetical protein
MQRYVPVVSNTGKPLMPTTNQKANKLIERGRAVRRFNRGVFYIQMLDRATGYTQKLAVGIDPGSKKEAFTIKSKSHTYLNIQVDAVTWVQEAEKTSTTMRRIRRFRNTPYRSCRPNRNQGKIFLPPSTKARWQWKLRLVKWLDKMYPIDYFVVEDICATPRKGKGRQWNRVFSPLQVGKDWFYYELSRIAPVETLQGYETKALREALGLKKSSNKMSDKFEAHCVDSWVLANWKIAGHIAPDNKHILFIIPLRFHRHQLHALQPTEGGIRRAYGGTLSLGLKRGAWIKHPKYGICYVGGTSNNRISLHSLQDGKRLCQNAKPEDCRFLTFASWRIRKEIAHSATATAKA